jgi:uncharacterized damage-inducible protein DinB
MDCTGKLSDADYRWNPGYGHGSIHDLLFHPLRVRVSYNWRGTMQTGKRPQPLAVEAYGDLPALQAGFATEQTAWSEFVGTLSEEDIAANLVLVDRSGEKITCVRWRLLQHVNFHAMQHHSEIAQLLTIKGQSPGDIDFLFFRD